MAEIRSRFWDVRLTFSVYQCIAPLDFPPVPGYFERNPRMKQIHGWSGAICTNFVAYSRVIFNCSWIQEMDS